MFEGITEERLLRMTEREKRWLDNIRKAFYESDLALQQGRPEDECLQQICKAVDTAKTLRRSLRGEDTSPKDHKRRFIEFLGLEIPAARPGGSKFSLRDTRSGTMKDYTLGEVIYEIRCMIHENENLNAAENVEHHILLDWSVKNPVYAGEIRGNRLICNGYFIWRRLREVLAKFITGIEGTIDWAEKRSFSITIAPKIGSIRPKGSKRRKQ
jgi:hypothetical protein